MTVATRAIFGRGARAGQLRVAQASQLPAAPVNNSLRDILMGRDSSTFEQGRVKAELQAAEVRDQNNLKGNRVVGLIDAVAASLSRQIAAQSRLYCDGDLSSGFNSFTMNQ
jgi:hypothetical protein